MHGKGNDGHVVLRNVTKAFGATQVLHGIDLEIASGRFVVIVGPSGCGKSTLLRMIAGLEDISSGAIEIDGAEAHALPPSERGVAMVFQSYALYPHMTVFENMAFGLKLANTGREEVRERVRSVAQTLKIDDLLERKPKALSGGQRQRVAIGRALVRRPKIFLLDEPLSNLDAALRVQLRMELLKLHRELGATMIYVTHDQVEAMTLADEIVVLNQGKIDQYAAPVVLYENPRNQFVAGFIGSPKMNFIPCELANVSSEGANIKLPSGAEVRVPVVVTSAAIGARVTLGVRPEHMRMLRDTRGTEAQLSGRVMALERLGDETLVYVEAPAVTEGFLTWRAAAQIPVRIDEEVAFTVLGEKAQLFDANAEAYPRQRATALE